MNKINGVQVSSGSIQIDWSRWQHKKAGRAKKKPGVKIKTLGMRMYQIKYFLYVFCSDSFIPYSIYLCTVSVCLYRLQFCLSSNITISLLRAYCSSGCSTTSTDTYVLLSGIFRFWLIWHTSSSLFRALL